MTPLLLLAAAYLLGGIPFGLIFARLRGKDVRAVGSGNIGATNVMRAVGKAPAIATLLLDGAKGWLAVWLMARYTLSDTAWMAAAAVVVMLGHIFPVYLKFKGGKAVATFVGAYLYLAPAPVLACLALFVAIVSVTRYISLGSICAAALFPLGLYLIAHPQWQLLAASVISAALVIWRHSANIERLRAGAENVFSFGGKRA